MARPVLTPIAVLIVLLSLSQCSETTSPAPPAAMTILSGDNQYSLRGTELPTALTVRVRTDGGDVPANAYVKFTVIDGGGSLSKTRVAVNKSGRASTRLTLGVTAGVNRVRAEAEDNSSVAVVFTAVGSNVYCEEAIDTLQVCGSCPASYGPAFDLFLTTARSGLYPALSTGTVQINVSGQTAQSFAEYLPDQGFFPYIIFDAAFSPRGDYYIARRTIRPEILKVSTNGEVSHFASLDQSTIDDQVEIAPYIRGPLVGCDIRGPFIVGCRDTLLRFTEATYAGNCNNDAVASDLRYQSEDPLGEDIYFIYEADSTLRRLPLDSLTVEGQGLQIVAQLTRDEAMGANGMVVDDQDGSVYILVDTQNTKKLLQVSPAGVKSDLYDFFTGLNHPSAGGAQNDLAFRRPFIFTLDTLNDKLLAYDISGDLTPLFSDSLQQAKLSRRDSQGNLEGGERVGLNVLR